MATTSLWHIAGSLKDLVDYVENPEKTIEKFPELDDLWNAARYVQRPEATAHGQFVTAINCLKETAIEQMILTKQQYHKGDGYIAYHGYQSFKPGEVTPEQCHEIGVQFAKEMWGNDFQILVTTHLDREHLHNHFCFNSVSFRDGHKYNYSKGEQVRLREVSDRICLEHGLSVIKNPHKAPSRTVYFDERDGKPTRYNVYRDDLWDAIDGSRNVRMVERYLNALGYITDFTGAHWKMRLPQYRHFTRLDTLDDQLTPEFIRQNCGYRARYGNVRAVISYPPDIPEELSHVKKYQRRTSHIYRLYLYWCYELGILPKGTSYRPTSPFIREELQKLDMYDRETRFMAKNHIETLDELQEKMTETKSKMDDLIDRRTHITYAMRRASPERKKQLQDEKKALTDQIAPLREQLRLMQDIEQRSLHIDKTLDRVIESEEKAYQTPTKSPQERSYER